MLKTHLVVLVALASIGIPTAAKADTYSPYPTITLGFGRGSLVGLTATGTQVTSLPFGGPCGTNGDTCYEIYNPSTSTTSFSTSNPGLTFDNGGPCPSSAIPSYFSTFRAVCNGSHEAFAGLVNLNNQANVIYLGPDGPGYIFPDEITDVVVDSLGDVSFNLINLGTGPDQTAGFIDESTRVSATPEPNSIALLGTGLAGAFALAKSRKKLLVRS